MLKLRRKILQTDKFFRRWVVTNGSLVSRATNKVSMMFATSSKSSFILARACSLHTTNELNCASFQTPKKGVMKKRREFYLKICNEKTIFLHLSAVLILKMKKLSSSPTPASFIDYCNHSFIKFYFIKSPSLPINIAYLRFWFWLNSCLNYYRPILLVSLLDSNTCKQL